MSFKSIMTFSLLVGASALELQPLGPASPGSTLVVKWSSSPVDPPRITLNGHCGPLFFYLVSSISTASLSQSFIVPNWISPTELTKHNIQCSIVAANAPPLWKTLDSVPISFTATSSLVTATTQSSQATLTDGSPTNAQASTTKTVSSLTSVSASSLPASSKPLPPEQTPESNTKPTENRTNFSTETNLAHTTGVPDESTAPSQSSSISSTTSIAGIVSPINSSSPLPNEGVKRPIGAIVGGVLGGIFGLAVIAATILYCRRKRRNASDLVWWTTRDTNVSPSPSLEEDWYAKAAVNEGIPGNTSAPLEYHYHDTDGRQNQNMSEKKNWTSDRTKDEELEADRERRREEIYEQMRRVLENDANGPNSKLLHK